MLRVVADRDFASYDVLLLCISDDLFALDRRCFSCRDELVEDTMKLASLVPKDFGFSLCAACEQFGSLGVLGPGTKHRH